MNCLSCQTANRTGARFCDACGTPLPKLCTQCGHSNRSQAKFCNNCGNRLETQSGAASTPSLLSTARPPVVPTMTGQRKFVTIMFADISGFTALSEISDPETIRDLINTCFTMLSPIVAQYEGTIDKIIGDSMMVLFGAPIAHENDPERALRTALEMMAGMTQFNEQYNTDLDLHIGINSGMVIAGGLGPDQQQSYSVMGDAVNLASRLESASSRGQIFVGETTYEATQALFDFQPLPAMPLKGKSKPVPVYQLHGLKEQPGQQRGILGLETTLIGRRLEVETLQAVMTKWKEEVGQVVCLVGEAGLGKSRLVAEMKTMAANSIDGASTLSLNWYEAASLSYETTQPYGLFKRLLRRIIGIPQSDDSHQLQQKLETPLPYFEPEKRALVNQVLAILFGLVKIEDGHVLASEKYQGDRLLRLDGETFKRELFRVFTILCQQWAKERATILVFEDIHWSDPASIDLLLHLLPLTKDWPLLLLCVIRPEHQSAGWQLYTALTEDKTLPGTVLTLTPLSDKDSDSLVESLLNSTELPVLVKQMIVEKSGGNPLFVEEIMRTLIDNGAIQQGENGWRWSTEVAVVDIDIPNNVQTLLTARIDRLDEETRRILQLAAVIGRSFYQRVLEAIVLAAMPASVPVLPQQLQLLQEATLIVEVDRLPEIEFMFRHILTQEAAYNTILLKHRRQFHLQVGQALEILFPNRVAELSSLLSYHYERANEWAKACQYVIMAGDVAAQMYAQAEAINYYTQALTVVEKQKNLPLAEWQRLYTARGRALELDSQFAAALRNYQEMEKVGRQQQSPTFQLAALVSQANIYSTSNDQGNLELGTTIALQALTLAQELGDEMLEAKIQWILLNNYRFTKKSETALLAGERALALAQKHNLTEQLAFVSNDLSFVYFGAGQIEKGQEILSKAHQLWQQLGNQPMRTDSLSTAAILYGLSGRFEQALSLAQEALDISQSIGNQWGISYSRYQANQIYWEQGQAYKALNAIELGTSSADEAGFMGGQIWTRGQSALAYAELGQINLARQQIAEAQQLANKVMLDYEVFPSSIMAIINMQAGKTIAASDLPALETEQDSAVRIIFLFFLTAPHIIFALSQGKYGDAAQMATTLLEKLDYYHMRIYLPRALLLRARIWLEMDDATAAQKDLELAQAEALAMGSRWHLWQIQPLLAQVMVQKNEADALREQAQKHLRFVISQIKREELKNSFLARPDVQALLR